MRHYLRTGIVTLIAAALAACSAGGDDARDGADAETSPAALSGGAAVPPGNRFDPTAMRPGARFMGFTVTSANVSRSVTDDSHIGSVRFSGDIEVSGRYHPHFDYPEVRSTCFTVDEASIPKLPRWPEDERRVWFCFENQEHAVRQLGAPGTSGDATIVIRRYQTVRSMSDAVDEAELVSVVRRGSTSSGG